jgi:ABC-2 type transport system ATP-binding protein
MLPESSVEVTSALHVDRLTAGYRRRTVLHDVSMSLPYGVHGLLGPNGAGKTTLFQTIAGAIRPTSGSVTVSGSANGSQAGNRTGYLPQRFDVMGALTVAAHVEYAAWVNGVNEDQCATAARKALEAVNLTDMSTAKAKRLSGGQRQRLGIASATAHEPTVLLLDEPTVGLDPLQRTQLRQYMSTIANRCAVLVSTHLVEDLAQIADSVRVLLAGRIVFSGSVDGLASNGALPSLHMSPLEVGYRELVQASAGER